MGCAACPGLQHLVRLPHHLHRIADQFGAVQPLRPRQFRRPDQGQPFGIAIVANPQIAVKMHLSAQHHGGLHRPRIGPAAAIEKQLYPAHRHVQALGAAGQVIPPAQCTAIGAQRYPRRLRRRQRILRAGIGDLFAANARCGPHNAVPCQMPCALARQCHHFAA